MKLQKKIALSFTSVFCLIISIFGTVSLHLNGQRYQQQGYNYCSKIVKANISLADTYFQQIMNISNIVATDEDIVSAARYRELRMMKGQGLDYGIELYNQRRVAAKITQLDILSNITNAVMISSQGSYLYYYGDAPAIDYNFLAQEWYMGRAVPGAAATFLNHHPTDYLLDNKRGQTVSLLMPVNISGRYSISPPAYLMCDFTLEPILGGALHGGDTQVAIFSGTEPVYLPGTLRLTTKQSEALNQGLQQEETNFLLPGSEGEPPYLIVAERSTISGWTIVGIESLKPLEELRHMNTLYMILLLVGAFFLALAVSWHLSRSILIPMDKLMKSFEAIVGGRENMRFEATGSVEVDRIASTAERMLARTAELNTKLLEDEQRLAEEQLKALQHQINPHFLNNVLQSIKALAVCGNVEAVSRSTTLLGKLLTYSVYTPYEKVPLARELEYIGNYIELQNVRFSKKIICKISCSAPFDGLLVPKMVIQPLVENAIEHGFPQDEGGNISVVVDCEDRELYITVTNSGVAIGEERVAQLNETIHQKDVYQAARSIGLANVLHRLRLCYGPSADLRIFSRVGMNTSIVLIIPIKEEGETC